ncbi:sensor histidine kinase [Stutzerimonas tarimensis]|uniref:histidine kinase n=1 Tax=Stutzerimonas tarimensis TaxID=1507735 RepID=A0ABV7T8C1_9GAMM
MTRPKLSRRQPWRTLALLSLLLLPLLWPLKHLAERYYTDQLLEQNRQTLDLYVANLLGTLHRYEVLPAILGDLPVLRRALEAPHPGAVDQANRLLEELRARTGADVLYLMSPQGITLAASNWQDADSFVNRDFAFRPYFRQAMRGELGRFFGLGTTSGKRGYYFSAAVRDGQAVLGAIVVKVDLDHTETLWGNTPEQLLVTDANGVVILTSHPEWRYHAVRELDSEERERIIQDRPYTTTSPRRLSLDLRSWLIQSRELRETDWTVRILAPTILVERPVRTVLAIGGATLLVLLLWLGLLLQRRRHLIERMALDARAREELEGRVQARTHELETLNSRLKGAVLEREQAQQELVRAQDELLQAGKLSVLGTMSASISHELNQPLAAMRSYADNAGVLLDHNRLKEARGNLQQISALTTRMASIISHLRAFARRDQRGAERVALQPALEDALSLIARRRQAMGVELIRDVPEATLWVQAGETRLRQILTNLLSNALDALGDIASPRRLHIAAGLFEDGVRVSLRDNGPGFGRDALGRAREPFFTTKASAEGLGLGLAICDTLVSALGGELRLGNHPEGGACVELLLQGAAPGTAYPNEDYLP